MPLCQLLFLLPLVSPTVAQTKFTSASGVRVIVQPDPAADTVAICVFVRAGLAEEDGVSGVSRLTARALFGSNYQHSADAVRRTIYATGGSLESSWTPDYTVYTCVTTREGFRDAVNLIAEAMKSAEFDADSLARARKEVLTDTARLDGDPFEVGYAAMRARLYADSPYRLPYTSGDETLRRTTPQRMRRFLERHYTPENTVIAIAGSVTLGTAQRVVEDQFVDYDRPAAKPLADSPAERILDTNRVVRRSPGPTTTVLVGCLAPAIGDPDYPAFVVLNALLGGGKSSRLFRQVRDVGGVGYSVGTYYPALVRPGHMVSYVEFDPTRGSTGAARADGTDLTTKAERLISAALHSPLATPPTVAEVERAKRFAIGSHALAHQRVRDRAFNLGLYETLGMGYAFDAELPAKLDKVTVDDVNRAASKYLTPTVKIVVDGSRQR